MRLVTKALWLLISMLAGAAIGLSLTYAAVDTPPNFGVVQAGPWVIRPGIGTPSADPYSKALMAFRGEIPLGASEGMMLVATRDSGGAALDMRCTYTVTGTVPAANFWTLTVHRHDGVPPSPSLRSAYTSSEALISEQGLITVRLSPRAQAGNWLPLAGAGRFELYLRLYETQITSSAAALDRATTPAINRESCG